MIVIFGGNPEYRHCSDTTIVQFPGNLDRSEGLQNGIHRSGQESGLLSCDDSHSTRTQLLDRAGVHVPSLVLRFQCVGQSVPMRIIDYRTPASEFFDSIQ